jgi:membrane protein DedA with SNARE-associated domain
MWEIILKIFSVYVSSMLKFILGPIGGFAAGLNFIVTILTTIAGMMTIVLVFTFSGTWFKEKVINRFFNKKKKNKFSSGSKRFVTIWKKYGLTGVAALTPVILTPIGGTVLALSSGSPKNKIIYYMLISAAVWSTIFTSIIYFFGNEVLPDWIKP